MEAFKLRLKIGDHEFEAAGERDAVEQQFAAWREMISRLPSPPPVQSPPAGGEDRKDAGDTPPRVPVPNGEPFAGYDRIFRRDDNVVSLSVLPQGETAEADAALLVLLGRKHYLNEDLVGGAWVLRGLEQSGLKPGERATRVFGSYMDTHVLKSGTHRAIRYRLSNPGMVKAVALAKELEQVVA